MTILSRLAKLGMAKETTPNTYLVPAVSIPFNSGTKYVDTIPPLRDESMRSNDVILQSLAQGPSQADWSVEVNGYPDLAGHWFRAMIGPDSVTPGVSTTLTANSAINAATISLTASVAANSVLQISDTAGANLEYVKISTVIGSGPFVATIAQGGGTGGTTTRFAHTAAGGAVISQTTHLFKQNRTFSTVWPTYSFTTNEGVDQLGWAGCVLSELQMKIDPKGFITFSNKYTGFPSAVEADFTYAASTAQPLIGWTWTVSNAGAASTRGLSMDLTFKRAVEAVVASDGSQGPREIFPAAMEVDGSYKAIFENDLDINLYKQALQLPTVHTVTQPVLIGGQTIAITMSNSGYTTGEKDLGQPFVQLDQAVSAIGNTTDSGVAQVSVSNFQTASY
jgi:hypothetical protein